MIRDKDPYNGKRYLFNTNTNELHDLKAETSSCKIAEIKADHIIMFDGIMDALIHAKLLGKRPDGCAHCLSEYHTG
jgi:hypothetical protein